MGMNWESRLAKISVNTRGRANFQVDQWVDELVKAYEAKQIPTANGRWPSFTSADAVCVDTEKQYSLSALEQQMRQAFVDKGYKIRKDVSIHKGNDKDAEGKPTSFVVELKYKLPEKNSDEANSAS